MRYASFDRTEFDCLNGLAGPLAMSERLAAEQDAAEARTRLNALRSGPPRGERLKAMVEERILAAQRSIPKDADRVRIMAHWVEQFREGARKRAEHGPLAGHEMESAAQQIRDLYFTFAVEAWHKDFDQSFKAEMADDPAEKEAKVLERRIESAERKAARALPDSKLRDFFGVLPNRWRDMARERLGDEEFCRRILESFCRDWRARQGWFRVPVTVTGTAIATLPKAARQEWEAAWGLMGLSAVQRKGVYEAWDSGQREPREPEQPAPSSVSKAFHAQR